MGYPEQAASMSTINPDSMPPNPLGEGDRTLRGAIEAGHSGGGDPAPRLDKAVNALARTLDARFREMGAEVQASQSVDPALLLDEVLDQLYESFHEVIPYDRVCFALPEDGGRAMHTRWVRCDLLGPPVDSTSTVPVEGTVLKPLLESGEPRVLDCRVDSGGGGAETIRWIAGEGMASALACPLVAMGRPVGFMTFSSARPDAYESTHARLFFEVANELATLLEKGILYQQLLDAQERSERLLLNVLPASIAARLKAGEKTIADIFPEATVLFADIASFTQISARMTPHALVTVLNRIFSTFDRLCTSYGLEKIKTIGDAIMVAGGLPAPRSDHVSAMAAFALDLMAVAGTVATREEKHIKLRIGIHTGPVIAGVIGTNRFTYDLWGDTVNIASRMESQGIPGKIQVSEMVYHRLKDEFLLESRGPLQIRGIGEMQTYFLVARKLPGE
jgi:class 3 adenylate cyclase